MENQAPPPATDWLNPLAGWEAASRWNRATLDWMAKGWQQWVALVTTVPPHFLAPPSAGGAHPVAQQLRAADALDARLRTREAPAASEAPRAKAGRKRPSPSKARTRK